MSDASEADLQEQHQPVPPPEEPDVPRIDTDPEVPEADALEQALPVPVDDDDFRE